MVLAFILIGVGFLCSLAGAFLLAIVLYALQPQNLCVLANGEATEDVKFHWCYWPKEHEVK